MRSSTIVAVALTASLFSTSAFAQDKKAAKSPKKKAEATLVASADAPLSALPAPEPTPAPTPAPTPPATTATSDAAATSSSSSEPASSGPGLHLSVGTGLGGVGGEISSSGGGTGALLASVNARIGGYVTSKLGFVTGLQVGMGVATGGCDGCGAGTYQIPVVAQYAFTDRMRGAFVEAGVGLFSTLTNAKDVDGTTVSFKFSAPVDFKAGVGYRFANAPKKNAPVTSSWELRFNADVGEFASVSGVAGSERIEGDIADGNKAAHYAMGLSLGYDFTP